MVKLMVRRLRSGRRSTIRPHRKLRQTAVSKPPESLLVIPDRGKIGFNGPFSLREARSRTCFHFLRLSYLPAAE